MTHSTLRLARATAHQALVPFLCVLSLFFFLNLPSGVPANASGSRAVLPIQIETGGEARPGVETNAIQTVAGQQRQKHLSRLGADRWHTAGYRGQGVKIAVLDTGFRGYRDHLGKALPAQVTVRSFRDDGNLEAKDSQHGILCGEVIHAIAPETELLFANWEFGRPDQYLAAIRWAREQGARLISCSVVAPNWSDGEGGGKVHEELSAILGSGSHANDLLCFASAGNTIDRHWSGRFKDAGDGFHEWKHGYKDNGLTPWSLEPVQVELYGRAQDADYELYVFDDVSGEKVAHASTGPHRDRCSVAIRFQPQSGHTYRVRVRLARGTPGQFHLTTTFGSVDCTTPKASVCFPADGRDVIAMGAVDEQGQRMWYSACGPNSSRPKPDLVATVPFASSFRERPFGGTSAAAPQGAALAALWWSRHPDWTAEQIRLSLRSDARDLGTPGHDFETGYGLIHLRPE